MTCWHTSSVREKQASKWSVRCRWWLSHHRRPKPPTSLPPLHPALVAWPTCYEHGVYTAYITLLVAVYYRRCGRNLAKLDTVINSLSANHAYLKTLYKNWLSWLLSSLTLHVDVFPAFPFTLCVTEKSRQQH